MMYMISIENMRTSTHPRHKVHAKCGETHLHQTDARRPARNDTHTAVGGGVGAGLFAMLWVVLLLGHLGLISSQYLTFAKSTRSKSGYQAVVTARAIRAHAPINA